jgi:hypothetical protein
VPLYNPEYLRRSDVRDTTVAYTWDDWKVEEAYEPLDDDLLARLAQMSYRANEAFTIACAEWIVDRFRLLSDDPAPINYIEAAWAAIVDWRYAKYFEPVDEEWQGPVRRALEVTMALTVEVIGRTENCDLPEISSASIANLAKHVMTRPEPFEEWQEWAVERLTLFYPRDEEEPLGPVVPREALDPDIAFSPSDTPEYINRFLKSLDFRKNEFLEPPETMLKSGFEGHPYTFNAAEDRRQRFEW